MAASSIPFANFLGSVSGMGSPLTPQQQTQNPFDPTEEKQVLPWIYTEIQRERATENDPTRIREQLQIWKEFRAEEAKEAARIQAERDKRAFLYKSLASIPETIMETSRNLAEMTLNSPALRIKAATPELIRQSWGSFPAISLKRGRTFS